MSLRDLDLLAQQMQREGRTRRATAWRCACCITRRSTWERSPSTATAFCSIPLEVPCPDQQRAIASVLGSLDDKIELNQQLSETLEAITRTIFKAWFVDFEPVRARRERRKPYGMDADTAALFSSEFEDSFIGQVPKGWK